VRTRPGRRSDTSDLKGQRRFGGDVELWLGRTCSLPRHGDGLTGRTTARSTTATQDPKYNAAMLQLEYVPKLPLVFYSRLRSFATSVSCRGRPDDYGRPGLPAVGVRHALS